MRMAAMACAQECRGDANFRYVRRLLRLVFLTTAPPSNERDTHAFPLQSVRTCGRIDRRGGNLQAVCYGRAGADAAEARAADVRGRPVVAEGAGEVEARRRLEHRLRRAGQCVCSASAAHASARAG